MPDGLHKGKDTINFVVVPKYSNSWIIFLSLEISDRSFSKLSGISGIRLILIQKLSPKSTKILTFLLPTLAELISSPFPSPTSTTRLLLSSHLAFGSSYRLLWRRPGGGPVDLEWQRFRFFTRIGLRGGLGTVVLFFVGIEGDGLILFFLLGATGFADRVFRPSLCPLLLPLLLLLVDGSGR